MSASADNPMIAIASPNRRSSNRRKRNTLSEITLFERCSGGLADLRFDSEILETFYRQCSFPQALARFRLAVAYLAVVSLFWGIYAAATQVEYWYAYLGGAAVGLVAALGLVFVSLLPNRFQKHATVIFLFTAVFFSVLTLCSFAVPTPSLSLAFQFSVVIQIVIVIYAMFPLKLWQVLTITIPLSVLHLILSCYPYQLTSPIFIGCQIIGHSITHAIGFILLLMSQVRRRSTFLDLGRSARMHQELKKEQLVRSEMIKSLMPDQVAKEVMQDIGSGEGKKDSKELAFLEDSDDEDQLEVPLAPPTTDTRSHAGIEESVGAPERAVEFRKFHVNQIEDVSILFADIVGFTKMSSNKSASHLVELLSDLFGRFDRLCELTGCEKIATLGDCYYCVAGCPNPVPDHAERACEMGRAMCLAIQQFDEDHKEEVNMRVGVHTGKVICGIVGTRRFKFDVWSNDVTLANEMESSGQAGKVHISETTLSFVDKIYEYEQGPDVEDIRQLKVLVEFFNKEDQCYAIKHTKNEAVVKTFFLNDRLDKKPVVELPRQTLHANNNPVADQKNSVVTPLISSQEEPSVGDPPEKERKISATLMGSGAPPIELRGRGSDLSLLEALRMSTSENQVFAFPPISPFSLRFKSDLLEQAYRRLGTRRPRSNQKLTWATPRMTLLVNLSAHAIISLLVILACVVAFPMSWQSVPLFVVIALIIFINLVVLVIVGLDAHTWIGKKCVSNGVNKLYTKMFTWYRRNLFGALLILLPSLLVLSGFRLDIFDSDFWLNVVESANQHNQTNSTFTTQNYDLILADQFEAMTTYRTILGILFSLMLFNCTLFTTFSSWTKSLSASSIVLLTIVLIQLPSPQQYMSEESRSYWFNQVDQNDTAIWMNAAGSPIVIWEFTIMLVLHLVLIWLLNREFDVSSRTSFNRDCEARAAKEAIAQEKQRADWLLENIIPSYVLTELRSTNKYSRHVVDAGVVFATISNFADFYDEQYQGGQEMLRVLNEIFADFEHQLPRFKDVEKIKTIGACFMAASGLNMTERARNREPDAHLVALLDFAIELIKVLDEFNRQMFSFKFDLKVGFNVGEVTAGVIGTTKLLYDIWGDTVNVASRMYSTGMKQRIQVTEQVAQRLSQFYEFEYRGEVFVKGKGNMKTYLLVNKK